MTLRPIDSSISKRLSIYELGILLSKISCLVLSAGESPSSAQSIFDSETEVGIKASAWNLIALASSSAGTRSMSATAVKTRCEGIPTATFLVVNLA